LICLLISEKVLAFFVKRCYTRLSQKAFDHEHNQFERCVSNDESVLNEFNLTIDDRVSKHCADYAREILFENPSFFLVGRRRDSL
jgi:hypothetical protein